MSYSLWSRLKSADHVFVIRYCVAIILAWYLSYCLDLDKPYWSMMTASIVSLPSPGSSIIKLLARLIGTTIGIIIIVPIVSLSQYDPWLMACLIALWVSFCHYICCCYYGSVSYCFALSGYTASIVGFATTTSPSSYTLFFISQARFTEIVLGLLVVFVVSFIFPSNKDQKALIKADHQLQKSLVSIMDDCVISASSVKDIIKSVTGFILQMMNIKVLATQYIFSSTNTSEKGVQAITNIYRSFDTLGSLIMLRIMKSKLISEKPNINNTLTAYEQKVEAYLDNPIAESPKPISSNDIYIQSFYDEFDKTTSSIAKPANPIIDKNEESLFFIRSYHDQKEAIYNGLRTFLTIMCAVFFWLHGNWQYGYIGVILLSVICCYLSMIPMIRIAILFAALGLIVGIIIAYCLKFGVFISTSEYIIAVLSFLVVIVFLCYIQVIFSPIWALFGFVTIQVIIFSISFQNPMAYDIVAFSNTSLMILFGMLVIMGVLYILPPSPEEYIISRMKKAVNKKFIQCLNKKVNFIHFKIYLASVINESKFVTNQDLKGGLITDCFSKFLIMHTIYQYKYCLLNHSEVLNALIAGDYKLALSYANTLRTQETNNEFKVFWWKIGCVLELHTVLVENYGSQ